MAATADNYPSGPIKLVMPYPAGGMSDVSARTIAEALSAKIGGNIIVENRPGAASTVASNWMVHQKPDGYTLYAAPVSLVLNPILQPQVGYKPYEDFTPISMLLYSPFVLQVNKDMGADNVKDLVTLIKAHPGKYAIGTSGLGSINHLAAEYFINEFGLDMIVAHYKGGAPASQDLVGGQIHMMFSAANEAAPMMRAGRTKGLAVTTAERLSMLPDVPTMNEAADLKDFEAVFWMALVAPKNLPPEIQSKLSSAMLELNSDAQLRRKTDALGVRMHASDPQEVTANLRQDEKKWGDIINNLDIEL
ncbi:Bug family tripartite tricarboxylate transporter substrate binding protein [Allopusillimonas ginsengisoli]|uniref:Bug family tripartite tricarboxylate transporter substrate binding protein n=1 Tax=Allopusillimonas ginsengisoli TaxID=453575 RepID=UPI001FD649F5|nr:tripartite tricarboxylate transporter substrate binding protein [Allopusillimonas ginsengisoli]